MFVILSWDNPEQVSLIRDEDNKVILFSSKAEAEQFAMELNDNVLIISLDGDEYCGKCGESGVELKMEDGVYLCRYCWQDWKNEKERGEEV